MVRLPFISTYTAYLFNTMLEKISSSVLVSLAKDSILRFISKLRSGLIKWLGGVSQEDFVELQKEFQKLKRTHSSTTTPAVCTKCSQSVWVPSGYSLHEIFFIYINIKIFSAIASCRVRCLRSTLLLH